MEKPIKDYLPKKTSTALVQARVDKELNEEVKKFMERNDLTWSELVTACFRKLIDETKKEKL